ncbi:AAA family ATPase [Hoyosella rhizosphaerae]|uniref:LuxR family transcriptional regulator n=1 Tax=Hoyosella rhizosphaerae TaxID=1755582 RepID=A0A916U3P1_9ACTN|nr:helix-turn-helix transcriptional regulator [Hoyosella rhizosphaerae]MBN4926839.1 AAA family ATPase [Hoyosella rhizosphaerae]GGC56115.1 LuxR family transcriptional regulator [Hoyosella rhizosphaerae]
MVEPLPLSAPTGSVNEGTAFVGRRAEVQRLHAVWRAVQNDRRHAIFIGGEPGVGKTRLISEVVAPIQQHGAAVLWGSCRADLDVPYRPFVSIVDHILEHESAEVLGDVPTDIGSLLLRITPHAKRRWPDLPMLSHWEGDSRLILFDAVLKLVLAVAEDRPTVLVVEDLHWAPEPTLAMLAHLVESTDGERLLILATRRTTAPDRSDAMTFALADLQRLDGVDRIDLVGLRTEHVAAYLVREAGVSLGAASVAAPTIRDLTGGNPFFLQEYWHDLAKRGGLSAFQLPTDSAPQSVQDALESRLAGFEPAHARVIEAAAVAGDVVDAGLLVHACGLGTEIAMKGVDFGVRAGLLVADDAGYRFVHALARHAVLDRMSATEKATVHARVAVALEQSHGEDDPALVADLARHYFQARAVGHADKAVHFLVLAARQAERSVAHGEAAKLYEQAARVRGTHGPNRIELLSSAARCHMHAGDFVTAQCLYEKLAADPSPRVRLLAAIGHEDASWRPGVRGELSLSMLGEALDSAELDPDDPLCVRAVASMGRAAAFTGNAARARVLGEDALRRARALGDQDLIAHALATTLWQGLSPQTAPELPARAVELHAIGSHLGNADHRGPAAFFRGVFAYIVGDQAAWSSAQSDLTELALSRGQPFYRYVAGCCRYAHRYSVGDYAAARHIVEWLDQFNQDFDGVTAGSWGVQQFMLRRVTNGLEEIRSLITGEETLDDHWLPGLLAMYTELELWHPAARLLTHLCDRIDDYLSGGQAGGVLAFMSEAAVRLEDPTAAAVLRPLIADYSGANLMAGQFVAVFGSADRYLGELDSVLATPGADKHFEKALAMDRNMGAVTHQVETLAAWSRHRSRYGGSAGPPAAQLADEARALARQVGHRGVLRDLDAGPLPDVASPRLPNGLTEREVDVLRLVAAGLSNREIGEHLFISANTAANHVRSILNKTDSSNRTKAAVFAAEHGLM